MKIGILTFHRATNYGAILQAYGLVSYLKKHGHEVQVIDYKPTGMGLLYAPINVPTLFRKLKRIALNVYILPSLPARAKKRKMFWRYTESHLPLTNKVYKEEDLPSLDAIFVGSDQVWSSKFTGGVDKFYWGQFDKNGAKLLSYAGSAAEDMDGSFYNTHNVELLKSFDAISVREDELKEYLQRELPQKQVFKVLDPTLLAGKDVFEELVKTEKDADEPYILIYQVIRDKDKVIQQYAKIISEKLGCAIYEIKKSQLYITCSGETNAIPGLINPSKFVHFFKNAKYVITTSFHGTAFSLLFNRPFSVVSVSAEVDSRAKDILQQLNLDERMITLPHDSFSMELDWDSINARLEEKRRPSELFIENSLK